MAETRLRQDKAASSTSSASSRPPHQSRYLIDEPPIALYPSLAVALGSGDRAAFLQQLNYWLAKSTHRHDGRHWVYNTYEGWQQQLPWLSVPTIRRIITYLRSHGIVLTANHNRDRTNRTLWYSIDEEALERYLGEQETRVKDVVVTAAASDQDEQTATAQSDQLRSDQDERMLKGVINTESTNRESRRESREITPAREAASGTQSTGPSLPGQEGNESGTGLARSTPCEDQRTENPLPTAARRTNAPPDTQPNAEWLRDSNSRPDVGKLSTERCEELKLVLETARDFYRELGDLDPARSALAVGNLFLRGEYGYSAFYDVMLLTRSELRIAQQHQRPGEFIRNKGAYYYSALANNLRRSRQSLSEPAGALRGEKPRSDGVVFTSDKAGFGTHLSRSEGLRHLACAS